MLVEQKNVCTSIPYASQIIIVWNVNLIILTH